MLQLLIESKDPCCEDFGLTLLYALIDGVNHENTEKLAFDTEKKLVSQPTDDDLIALAMTRNVIDKVCSMVYTRGV